VICRSSQELDKIENEVRHFRSRLCEGDLMSRLGHRMHNGKYRPRFFMDAV